MHANNKEKTNFLRPHPPAGIFCGTGREVSHRGVAEGSSLRFPRLQPVHQEGGWPQVGAERNWWY